MFTQYLAEYGLFFAKSLTIVAAILLTIGGVIALAIRQKKAHDEHLEVTHLNKKFEQMEKMLKTSLYSHAELKQLYKQEKKQAKAKNKADQKKVKEQGRED